MTSYIPSFYLRVALLLLVVASIIYIPTSAQQTQLEDCILIIGDSIAGGQAVSQVPGRGFPVIVSEPFTRVLDRLYNDLNITHVGIYNLAVGASSLGSSGDVQYINTPQYAFALSKRCQFAVIFPWINDLPETADIAAANAHVNLLARLTTAIHAASPQTQVVILDYYRVVQTELGGRVYGNMISPAVIGTVNQTIAAACASNGILGQQPNTSCFSIERHLLPLDSVLMTSITATEFNAQGFRAYDIDGQNMINEFWAGNPASAINVDGVHLNAEGKRRLAVALQNYLQGVKPTAFQTVAPF